MTDDRNTASCPHCGGEMDESAGGGWFESSDYACLACGVSSMATLHNGKVDFVPFGVEDEPEEEDEES